MSLLTYFLPPKDSLCCPREEEKSRPPCRRLTQWAQEAAIQCGRGPCCAARVHDDGLLGPDVLPAWHDHTKAFHAQVRNRKEAQNFQFSPRHNGREGAALVSPALWTRTDKIEAAAPLKAGRHWVWRGREEEGGRCSFTAPCLPQSLRCSQ